MAAVVVVTVSSNGHRCQQWLQGAFALLPRVWEYCIFTQYFPHRGTAHNSVTYGGYRAPINIYGIFKYCIIIGRLLGYLMIHGSAS